jgi:hypothetical protein
MAAQVVDADYLRQVDRARRELRALVSVKGCAPIMLRLAHPALIVLDHPRPPILDSALFDIRDSLAGGTTLEPTTSAPRPVARMLPLDSRKSTAMVRMLV